MKVIHILDPQRVIDLPAHHDGVENWGLNATPAEILAAGFRPFDGSAVAPEGERITASHIEHDATHAWQLIDATANLAAEAAAAAAAEIERKATPLIFDQPIEVPALVLLTQTDMLKGVGLIAYEDADGYHLTTYEQHASPNPDAAEVKARKDAAIAADKALRKAAKDELDALKAKAAKAEADLAAATTELVNVKTTADKAAEDVAKLKPK
jgi:hypothetical protein